MMINPELVTVLVGYIESQSSLWKPHSTTVTHHNYRLRVAIESQPINVVVDYTYKNNGNYTINAVTGLKDTTEKELTNLLANSSAKFKWISSHD